MDIRSCSHGRRLSLATALAHQRGHRQETRPEVSFGISSHPMRIERYSLRS